MRRMSELFEGFNINQAMMMAAAGSHEMDGLAGRVAKLYRDHFNLKAADPQKSAEGAALLNAVEAAVKMAEAFYAENVAPIVRLIHASSPGDKHTIIVTGAEVLSHMGAGQSGIPTSLKFYASNVNKFETALLQAYRKSHGNAEAVLRAAKETSSRKPETWSIKK